MARQKIWAILLETTLLFGGLHGAVRADVSEARAIQVIQRLGLDRNLKFLGGAAAGHTSTYQMVVRNNGESEAHLIPAQQLDAAVPRYKDQSDWNMEAAYLDHLTIDEMEVSR